MNSVLLFVLGEGLTTPALQSGLGPIDYHLYGPIKKMLGGQKLFVPKNSHQIAKCNQSVAWTAASIVLCIRHSECC